MSIAQSPQTSPLPVEGVAQTSTVPKVKVSIKFADNTPGCHPTLTVSHDVGHAIDIVQHFHSSAERSKVNYYANAGYALTDCIRRTRSTIGADAWAEAIASEIIGRISRSNEASIELSAVASHGYIVLNDGIYKLNPIQIAPQSRVLTAARKRILEKSKLDAEKIVNLARIQEKSILDTAATKQLEAQRLLMEARRANLYVVPTWMLENRLMISMYDNCWEINFMLPIQLKYFEYPYLENLGDEAITIKHWNAIVKPPQQVLFGIRISMEGAVYNYRDLRVVKPSSFLGLLPHVTEINSCMSLADAPSHIKDFIQFSALQNSVMRCMAGVDLSSLYVRANKWMKPFQDALPPAIKDICMIQTGDLDVRALRAAPCDSTRKEEHSETWTSTPTT
jgi:hypothetical protein